MGKLPEYQSRNFRLPQETGEMRNVAVELQGTQMVNNAVGQIGQQLSQLAVQQARIETQDYYNRTISKTTRHFDKMSNEIRQKYMNNPKEAAGAWEEEKQRHSEYYPVYGR